MRPTAKANHGLQSDKRLPSVPDGCLNGFLVGQPDKARYIIVFTYITAITQLLHPRSEDKTVYNNHLHKRGD
jgi:hypothetical protein